MDLIPHIMKLIVSLFPLKLFTIVLKWFVFVTGIFERFRGILHEGEIDKRVQFLIEGLFAIRKAKFQVFSLSLSSSAYVAKKPFRTQSVF